MHIKVVRSSGNGDWSKEEIPQFRRFIVTRLLDIAGRDVGRRIELCYDDPPAPSIFVELSQGDVAYIEDANGNTTDSIKWWLPKEGQRQLRVTEREAR